MTQDTKTSSSGVSALSYEKAKEARTKWIATMTKHGRPLHYIEPYEAFLAGFIDGWEAAYEEDPSK
tara:strand:- start:63 stop:260 length:198 start_codon:yes stop_codon:yes gene_type:complete